MRQVPLQESRSYETHNGASIYSGLLAAAAAYNSYVGQEVILIAKYDLRAQDRDSFEPKECNLFSSIGL